MSNKTDLLTTDQICRVFGMHFGNKCVIELEKDGYSQPLKVDPSILQNISLPEGHIDKTTFKLLLTPLDKLSLEDAIAIFKIEGTSLDKMVRVQNFVQDKDKFRIVYWFIDEEKMKSKKEWQWEVGLRFKDLCGLSIAYLMSKGYAIPLFFEPGHPLNGKTAIESGLAIDKTTLPNE
jgi:hypothetical protein